MRKRIILGAFVVGAVSAAGGWLAADALVGHASGADEAARDEASVIGRRPQNEAAPNPAETEVEAIDLRELVRWSHDDDDLLSLVQRVSRLPRRSAASRLAWRVLGNVYAGQAPSDIAVAAAMLEPRSRERFLRAVIDQVSPDAITALMKALDVGIDQKALWYPLIRRMGQGNPLEALATAKLLGEEHGTKKVQNLFQVALFALAKVDPVRAARELDDLEMGMGSMGAPAASAIALQWAKQDAPATVAWLRELSKERGRWYFNSALGEIGRDSPEQLAALFEQVPQLWRDPAAVAAAADGLASSDPDQALAWVHKHVSSETHRNEIFQDLIYSVEEIEDRLKMLDQIPPGSESREYGVEAMADSWAEAGDPEVMTWAEALEDPRERRAAVSEILEEWADEAPDLLLEYRDRIIEHDLLHREDSKYIFESLAAHDLELAKEWVRTLPDDLRDHALMGVGVALARSDPAQGAVFLESMPDSAGKVEATQHLVTHWAMQDAVAAADWVLQQPEGESRDYAFGNLVHNWAPFDPEAASGWLAAQPDSRAKDRAAAELVEVIAWQDPEAAFVWAESIGEEEIQQEAYQQSLVSWLHRNREAGLAALERADLSEDRKSRLLEATR